MKGASIAKCFVLFAAVVHLSYGRGVRLCGSALNKVLNNVCSYRNQTTPCYKGAFFDIESIGRVRTLSTVDGIATECCNNGCYYSFIKSFCCFSLECLRHCYPNTTYTEQDIISKRAYGRRESILMKTQRS
uniref:Insulin-like domain-containing protein n=1 Tax=Plectus sambesii TaxID=2011161 RepID=A0A914XDD7_9BILA